MFVQVQGSDVRSARMMWRWSEKLEGPWSAPVQIYDPPERPRSNIWMYAFKAHPHLAGADLVATYASNGFDEVQRNDEQLYYPRFIRLTMARA